MSLNLPDIYETRASYSRGRLEELTRGIGEIEAASRISGLAIFVVGSYARLEASEHSDIDPFFICCGTGEEEEEEAEPRTNQLEMFGDLIRLGKNLGFPKFSSDAKYLEVHSAREVKTHLGSREDDARNLFTLRLLLLLESCPVFGVSHYESVLEEIIDAYFRDYPDHQATFEPTFLINDIARYWRTLLANYEHLRNQRGNERDKIKQKVKNYKLKYSRLTTCFATISCLASYPTPVTPEDVQDIVRKCPRERLELIANSKPGTTDTVLELLEGYSEFLKMTQLSTPDLEKQFEDKTRRRELFDAATNYGDVFYRLLCQLDELQQGNRPRLLRTLVI